MRFDHKVVPHLCPQPRQLVCPLITCYPAVRLYMRYLHRTHRVSVARLHEAYARDDFQLLYEKTDRMCADIYTKAFTKEFTKECTKDFAKEITKGFTKEITKEITKDITKELLRKC